MPTTTQFPMDSITLPKQLLDGAITAEGVDGKGSWSATYSVITIAKIIRPIGLIEIERHIKDDGAVLKINMQQNQRSGFVQKTNAVIDCRDDVLSTPKKWEWSEVMMGPDGPVPHTELKKSGVLEASQIAVSDKTGTRKYPIKRACAINWVLFDAVGRMPRKSGVPIAFDMIEHYDQVKSGCEIYYRGSKEAALKDGQATLHGFAQFGFGNVPWNYYVTEGGITVMAVGGLEAYVLESVNA